MSIRKRRPDIDHNLFHHKVFGVFSINLIFVWLFSGPTRPDVNVDNTVVLSLELWTPPIKHQKCTFTCYKIYA
jgi:hypothetical protein